MAASVLGFASSASVSGAARNAARVFAALLAVCPAAIRAEVINVRSYRQNVPVWDDLTPESGREGVVDLKSYRSIDTVNVPVWDEFVPTIDKVDYADQFDRGELSPGEWGWWKAADDNGLKKIMHDAFWYADVDADAFEKYTDRESLDNRNMILYDLRSCPYEDTVKCKEWLETPHSVEFLPDGIGYRPTIDRKTDLEIEIEELLKTKSDRKNDLNKWQATAVEPHAWDGHPEFDGCPFEVEAECLIWKAKPAMPETVSNRNPMVSKTLVESIVVLARAGNPITSDMVDARPLVKRYKTLMAAAHACCTSGLIYNLQTAGASKGLIYKFLVDDANFYQFGDRCLMITDDELDKLYGDTSTAEVVADIRNGCLCRKKEFFESLLAPFVQVATASKEFANSPLTWKYVDGLNRRITVSINQDVNAVLNQLRHCPD